MMDNNNTLSQAEIDALLNISGEDEVQEDKTAQLNPNELLTSIEEDTLGEIGNISFGTSATTLSTLLNQKVEITTPTVSIIKKPELYKQFKYEYISVQVKYIEGFAGENIFVLKSSDAAIISDIMLGGDGTSPAIKLTDIHLSAVQEVMNQMMGSAATSMSTIFNKKVNISSPVVKVKNGTDETKLAENIDEKVFVNVSFQLKVGDLIDSNIMQLIPFPFANDLVKELMSTSAKETEQVATIEEKQEQAEERSFLSTNEPNAENGDQASAQYIGAAIDKENAVVQQAAFSDFEHKNLNKNEQRNLDMLLDVPLRVTVELGRTKRPIKDILDLSAGSIVELDKLAGEPVDVLINEKLIAKGEVVVIDENFGVRVTDILSQTARLMKLK